MRKMNIKDIFLSMLGNNVEPMSEKELMEILDQGFEHITGMVFLPSEEGFLMMNEEETETEEDENELS